MKTLKPGPRPFIALGTICALIFLFLLYIGFTKGQWSEVGKMAGCALIFPALFFGPIAFLRVEIDSEEIRLRNFGKIQKKALFADIDYSVASVLAEKDWPVSLTMIGRDGSELMTLGLKVFRKEDVSWLVGLPQLKLQR